MYTHCSITLLILHMFIRIIHLLRILLIIFNIEINKHRSIGPNICFIFERQYETQWVYQLYYGIL